MNRIFKKSPLSRSNEQLKKLRDLLRVSLECENDVAKDLFRWASLESNYNLRMVFSCLTDLTDAYAKCIKQQSDKLHEFREVFKTIAKEEIALSEIEKSQNRANEVVSSLEKKVQRESKNQENIKAQLEDAVNKADTGQKYLDEKTKTFEIFKAENIRSALIKFNNDYMNILSDMLTIYQTRMAISEMLSGTPVYSIDELEQLAEDGNRLVKETLNKLNMTLPMRDGSLDRFKPTDSPSSSPKTPRRIPSDKQPTRSTPSSTPPPQRSSQCRSTSDSYCSDDDMDSHIYTDLNLDKEEEKRVLPDEDGLYVEPIAESLSKPRLPPANQAPHTLERPLSPPPPPPGPLPNNPVANDSHDEPFSEEPILNSPPSSPPDNFKDALASMIMNRNSDNTVVSSRGQSASKQSLSRDHQAQSSSTAPSPLPRNKTHGGHSPSGLVRSQSPSTHTPPSPLPRNKTHVREQSPHRQDRSRDQTPLSPFARSKTHEREQSPSGLWRSQSPSRLDRSRDQTPPTPLVRSKTQGGDRSPSSPLRSQSPARSGTSTRDNNLPSHLPRSIVHGREQSPSRPLVSQSPNSRCRMPPVKAPVSKPKASFDDDDDSDEDQSHEYDIPD
ncbi:uncharacterized protein [Amphiura filiformis]|uniref:uncharacterized protein n=1 Tax=Amphiura filiformis TaxID=82378 RepID=UPI003B2135BF